MDSLLKSSFQKDMGHGVLPRMVVSSNGRMTNQTAVVVNHVILREFQIRKLFVIIVIFATDGATSIDSIGGFKFVQYVMLETHKHVWD